MKIYMYIVWNCCLPIADFETTGVHVNHVYSVVMPSQNKPTAWILGRKSQQEKRTLLTFHWNDFRLVKCESRLSCCSTLLYNLFDDWLQTISSFTAFSRLETIIVYQDQDCLIWRVLCFPGWSSSSTLSLWMWTRLTWSWSVTGTLPPIRTTSGLRLK